MLYLYVLWVLQMLDSYTHCALLWLRNHYDVGRSEDKERVLKVIDKILDERQPTVLEMHQFREHYLKRSDGKALSIRPARK